MQFGRGTIQFENREAQHNLTIPEPLALERAPSFRASASQKERVVQISLLVFFSCAKPSYQRVGLWPDLIEIYD